MCVCVCVRGRAGRSLCTRALTDTWLRNMRWVLFSHAYMHALTLVCRRTDRHTHSPGYIHVHALGQRDAHMDS